MVAYNLDPMVKAFLGNLVMKHHIWINEFNMYYKNHVLYKYANGGLLIEPLPFYHLPITLSPPTHYPIITFPLPFATFPLYTLSPTHYPFCIPFLPLPIGGEGVNLLNFMRCFYNTSQCMRHLIWSHDAYLTVSQPNAK